MPKITVELDLDTIITAKDKTDALYKALRNDVLNRSGTIIELKNAMIERLLGEADMKKVEEKVAELFKTIFATDESTKTELRSHYGVTNQMVRKAIEANQKVIDDAVLKYLISGNFVTEIGELVKTMVSSRIAAGIAHSPHECHCD